MFTEDMTATREIDFSRFGTRIGTRMEGKKAQTGIEAEMASLPYGETLFFDLRKVDLLGYSFADEAIAIVFQRLVANEYGEKFIAIRCDNKDILDGIESALEKRELAAIGVESSGKWFLIGELKDYQRETLKAIMDAKEIKTSELAEKLDIEVSACGNRLTELSRLKLINRTRILNVERGSAYLNKSILGA